MANIPFPPLFCSTPPPIDDANYDDDEEFGDFADAYQENLNLESTCNDNFTEFPNNIEQLPEKDISEINIPKLNINCDSFDSKYNDRLINNQTTHASLSSLSEQTSSTSSASKSPPLKNQNELEDDFKDFSEYQYDKNLEVGKSDSDKIDRDIYTDQERERSTENDSVLQEAIGKKKDLPTLNNIVLLEDLDDDSSDDERLSPRNRNVIRCDESSSDFFAIYPVNDVDKREVDTQNSVWEASICSSPSICESSKIENYNLANEEDGVPENETYVENQPHGLKEDSKANDPIISDDIKNSSFSPETSSSIESSPNKSAHSIDIEDNVDEDDDDDFANFQDFTSAPVATNAWPKDDTKFEISSQSWNVLPPSSEVRKTETVEPPETEFSDNKDDNGEDNRDNGDSGDNGDNGDNGDGDEDENDDDDFGDFSEAPVVTVQQNALPKTSILSVTRPLADQLNPILDLMFPKSITPSTSSEASMHIEMLTSNSVPMELALVESAKALEYQWTNSFVRHGFIKSLGIDSRNIFLTEKWNSSMPRFAANLSFDPLQPLKTTSVPLHSTEHTSVTSKPEVPIAEFDWKSSGLVNPLDASHVHTLLLDVDQLVVVANLDNINLDSYSSCSQSSTTLTTTTTTTTSTTSMESSTSLPLNETNNINGEMATTTEKSMTNMMSKIRNDDHKNDDNGFFAKTFHGDNLQLNSIGSDTQCTTDTNASDTANNINDFLSTNLVKTRLNDCNLPFPTHLFNNCNNNNNNNNNNINNNTSFDAFNAFDTICFDAKITTATESHKLLLPTTSVAFTNNLQFNELHNSLATQQPSSNLTPINSSITTTTTTNNLTIITTTTTTTIPPPTSTEITNIAHHNNKKMQMPMSTVSASKCVITNPYRESRPQAEMARQSTDSSKTEYRINDDDIENETEIEIENSDTSTSSANTTTETSTIATTTAGGTLSSIITGSGDINSTDNNINNNIDIGLFDMLSSKSINQLPNNVKQDEDEINCNEDKESKVLEVENFTPNESTVPLDMYSMNGETEVRIENGVISRSTFAGPLKETHIFTPSKIMPELYEKSISNTVRTISPVPQIANANTQKVTPIDFDYEKAAAGIIIDETVVHKEYRDVEYNPGFGLEGSQQQQQCIESQSPKILQTKNPASSVQQQLHDDESDDEFTDFQSVPAPEPECIRTATPRNEKLSTPTPLNGMILSPAILLPQAISMENRQPKIEWGNSATNIDPDELARIEQLFPQNNSSRNSSKKSSPTHAAAMQQNSLSISATIAHKSHDANDDNDPKDGDDDDWSDFVSVPVPVTNRTSNRSLQKPRSESNDDEWSDFVSSVPNTHAARIAPVPNPYGLAQFNSASWQNANFYNNPLSVYHRSQTNIVPNTTPTKLQNNNYTSHNKNNNNNNNRNHHNNNFKNSNNNFTQYLQNYSATPKLPQQQQIQVMQDFSTVPSDFTLYRPNIPHSNYTGPTSVTAGTTASAATPTSSHFQVGSAKVAPTVSLIPDLGFVAPAMPVHTAIINALPKSGGNLKQK